MLRKVRRRPELHLGRGNLDFEKLVAFVQGVDIGTNHRLLDGFREYLILRLGEESAYWWPDLVIKVCVPHSVPQPEREEDIRAAVGGLFDLLDEFLAEFAEDRSRRRVFQEYILWKQGLSFYDLDLERFQSSPPPELGSVEAAVITLDTTRTAFFDLVAAGELEVFRAGATALVRSSQIAELLTRQHKALGVEPSEMA